MWMPSFWKQIYSSLPFCPVTVVFNLLVPQFAPMHPSENRTRLFFGSLKRRHLAEKAVFFSLCFFFSFQGDTWLRTTVCVISLWLRISQAFGEDPQIHFNPPEATWLEELHLPLLLDRIPPPFCLPVLPNEDKWAYWPPHHRRYMLPYHAKVGSACCLSSTTALSSLATIEPKCQKKFLLSNWPASGHVLGRVWEDWAYLTLVSKVLSELSKS